jgi:hypothetical protein
MNVTSTMRGYGKAARFRAESMGHRAKDRMLEKRLDRVSHESDRLRSENEMLRDEVGEARSEHRRILDLLEDRLAEEASNGHRSHKGRWLIVLLALGGGAYALIRQMRQGEAWSPVGGATA